MTRQPLLLAATLGAATLALAACTQAPPAARPAASPPPLSAPSLAPSTAGPAQAPDSANAGGGPGGAALQANQPAAEEYAACLRERGIDAIALDGQVLFGAGAGTVESGQQGVSRQGTPSPVEAECRKLVPEYQVPDFNER